jgi:hypothetical protein
MPDQETTSALRVVSFQADIKPLFRASDRAAMQKAFDWWSFSDVSAYGTNIAETGYGQPVRSPCSPTGSTADPGPDRATGPQARARGLQRGGRRQKLTAR